MIDYRMGQHMVEMVVFHMLQGCLQYMDQMISWIRIRLFVYDYLGGR